jgi:hypothetical protein
MPLKFVIPAKAGIHCPDTQWADEWIPAFARMTVVMVVMGGTGVKTEVHRAPRNT